jgi:tRNA(fMet)-specific endonuclease VapC
MNLALDTNRYTDMARGVVEAVALVASASDVFLPLIVLGELRAGFRQGTREAENEAALRAFLSKPGVHVLPPDERTTHKYAEVEAHLRRIGKAIPTNDVWIAALALQHDLPLYSRAPHFDQVPGLNRV